MGRIPPPALAHAFLLIGLAALADRRLHAQAPVPIGVEFQVNSFTPAIQAGSVIASESNGDFVIVWQSFADDGSDSAVVARRFASSGVSVATAFLVNSYTPNSQQQQTIDMDADGDFVVAWRSYGQDGGSHGIFAQRFDSSGVRRGVEFQVNTVTIDSQVYPDLALDANGNFAVVWGSLTRDGASYAIALRRFNSSGSPQGVEVVVNSFTLGEQNRPAVDADADGDLVVTWDSAGQDGSERGVFGQRFGSSGARVGPEFPISTHFTASQHFSTVGLDADGDFVVAWQSEGQDGALAGVFGRRFNSAGTPLTGEFSVNVYAPSNQEDPGLTVDADGDFVVVWQSDAQEPGFGDALARRFKASGLPQSDDMLVNTFNMGFQSRPRVAANAEGDFVVTWASPHDGGSFGIFAQRFDVLLTIDVDGDGSYLPLTDGVLLLRFGFGFSGATLITGAVGVGCTRCDVPSITAYLQTLV
jgi:hypothetical protein